MNFFKRIAALFVVSITLLASTLVLEKILQMYQNSTLSQHPEAVKFLITQADTDADAAFLLATSYKDAKIGPANLNEAYKWYTKAAKMGDGDAMLMLGWLYYNGKLFGSSNIKKAKYWFTKAADKGVDEAIEMLEILNS